MARSLIAATATLAVGLVMSLGAGQPALAQESAGPAVPTGFSPSSTSWTAPSTGWVLGWSPCGSQQCATLLHTTDGGTTWSAKEAPDIRPSEVGAHTRVFFAERNGHSTGLVTNGRDLYVSYDAAGTCSH